MHAAEEKVNQGQTDAYDAKTRHDKYQRQQRREREYLERRLTNEPRQAERRYAKAPAPDANLMQELRQAVQAARAEAAGVRNLQQACGALAIHGELIAMKGADIDETRQATIRD